MAKLAYLFPAFPVFHQTFVLWEVLGLRRNGLEPKIYSLKRGTDKQQPEAQGIASEVTYLPGLASQALWAANWRRLKSAPTRYFQLYLEVIRAWGTGAAKAPRQGEWDRRAVPLRDRLRGWYNRQPFLYLLKSLLLVPSAVELAERLESEGVTHLHVHWATYPTTVAYVVNALTGIPFSFSAHAYDIYMVTRMLPAKIHAARFVATCAKANAAFLRQLAEPRDGQRVQVIYHGVDVSRFTPNEKTVDDVFRIVSCGQLERYKGFHHLIDACAELVKRGIRLECRIVGEGPWRATLQQRIDQHRLGDQVTLTGALPHRELAALLGAADVFALASELGGKSGRRDVIANVLVEAMAAGLPVVATRIPGAEELIVDEVSGFLVRPNQHEQLAMVLQQLAEQPALRARIGRAARQRVLQDFDNSKNIQTLATMLSQAARDGERRTPPVAA